MYILITNNTFLVKKTTLPTIYYTAIHLKLNTNNLFYHLKNIYLNVPFPESVNLCRKYFDFGTNLTHRD